MKRNSWLIPALLLMAAGNVIGAEPAAAPTPVDAEVVFVLDTTGSMSGLIEGAKKKIWSIASDIGKTAGGKVRIGLVPYRDRGDNYVTQVFDLTDDLDLVFGNLQKFQADGGGDTPESVNQALNEAVSRIEWSEKPGVMRSIFLVGDCPPHMDYQDDVKYPESCRQAAAKGIVIHTVQCGSATDTTPVWQDIARRSDGDFSSVDQDGAMRVVATPYDTEIAALTVELGATVQPYGSAEQVREVKNKAVTMADTAKAAPAVAATRNAYQVAQAALPGSGGDLAALTGRGDLVNDADTLEKIKALPRNELPTELQSLPAEEIHQRLEVLRTERRDYNRQLEELNGKRETFLRDNATSGAEADSFDVKVRKSIERQLQKLH